MNLSEMRNMIEEVSYKPGWTIVLSDDGTVDTAGRPYIQLTVDDTTEAARSPFGGPPQPWKSGKRYLSKHMCRQEIVGACFGLIRDAEEHEMREWFKFKGRSIYNPHLSPDVLAGVAVLQNMSLRSNAMSMEE